ncbi:MAG: ABC transporter substrate-binding protein [Bacillota bacterium]
MKHLFSIAVVLALVFGLVACGSAEEGAEHDEPFEIVYAQGADAGTLLAMEYIDHTTHTVIMNTYDSLIDRDPADMSFIPRLATEWEVLDDLTWEFELRDDVYFHNGAHFTSEAVKFTIEYILDEDNEMAYLGRYSPITEVEIIDDYTLRIHTSAPMPILMDRLTSFHPLEPGYVQEVGHQQAAENPIGTGPMKFVSWDKEERIVLEKNEDYWGREIHVDRITFRPIPEFSTRTASLMTGEVDIIRDVPGHMVDEVNASEFAEVRAIPSSRINYIALVNLKEGPMQSKLVRQAMNYAVNVPEMIEYVLDGYGNQMAGCLSELNRHYNPDLEPYPYDPDRAVELIREAGYEPSELSLVLDTPDGRYPQDREVALAVADYLSEIGIDVEVRVNEWGTHLEKIMERETGDMFLLGWGPALEAQGTIESLMSTDRTYSGFGLPDLDVMIAEATQVVDLDEQVRVWREIEAILYEEAAWIFLWQQYDAYGVSKRLDWTPRADEVSDVLDMRPR